MALSTTKVLSQLSLLLSELVLFIPKGFLLGSVECIDSVQPKLKCKKIACIYCDRIHISSRKNSYLKKKLNQFFKVLKNAIYEIIKLSFTPLYLLIRILPKQGVIYCLKKLNALNGQIRHGLKIAAPYRTKTSFYIVLPLMFLALCAHTWGLAIIPEIYIFLAASSWSGTILNFAANLIVRGHESQEWQFATNWWSIVFCPQTEIEKNTRWDLFKKTIRLILELTLLSTIGRLAHFINYATTAFFSWLFAYVLFKEAAEEGQNLLLGLENKIVRQKQSSVPLNATWLLTYHIYKESCSTKSFEKYQTLHENQHKYALRKPRHRTSP